LFRISGCPKLLLLFTLRGYKKFEVTRPGIYQNFIHYSRRKLFMATKIYVGNLSYETDEEALQELCGQYGTVQTVNIIKDHESGRSKGFGFVEMAEENDAKQLIDKLNGYEVDGRQLKVSEARDRDSSRGGGGGRRDGGGGYGGGGGRRDGGGGGGFGGKRRY
jgi:RNA recognition motif-containing protein